MNDIQNLAAGAFEEARDTGVLGSLGRDVASNMAEDLSGGDPAAYAAAMDEFRTQEVLDGRERLMQEDEADAEALHMGVRETMLRTLGVTDDEYARTVVDGKLGDTSTMLALKEAYVFR